jgi:hypothetical protein
MTPLEIKILLDCYSSGDPGANIPANVWDSQASKDARERFYDAGILRADTNAVTLAGKNLVDRLMNVPMMPRSLPRMEPLGAEFEKVWDDNASELYRP